MATVRRVRRIVRKIDPWTVLKVSFVFYAILALAMVLGVVILWAVARNIGIPQGIDEVAVKLTLLDSGDTIFGDTERWFLIVVFMGVVWTVLMTGVTTLFAVIYNLVSDVVGGIEVVVLEESLNVPAVQAVRTPQQWTGEIPPPAAEPTMQELLELPTEETEPVSVATSDQEPGTPEETDGVEEEQEETTGDDQPSTEYDATPSPDRTAAST